ncbi:unnamed protein product [Caenorhabditis angaria]|uniref:Peroxin/Ferlin domain-containing protein n=1 Tax=Caenorhabditis angaria TaxID=860376 RepID=A0A9P1IC54_9PELO|nr:unnamed protein product [Caenorhabditis angaria]
MEFIWMVAEDGIPWRMPILEEPKDATQVEWEPVPCSASYSIRQIAASSKTAFALDRSGRILMLVLPTHIALRQKIEVYVNQRWYPLVKWRRPLPTDRSEYSDESGKLRRDLEYFEDSPVDGWSWEEPWRTNRDPRSFDDQGWQYAITFLGANSTNWDRQCKRHHFVRRKILRRHMRFTQHDKWIEFSPEDDSKMFVELACGGAEIMEDGEILLFALGTDGNIYRRAGIRTNIPNGTEWCQLPKIQNPSTNEEIDDVTLLAISPTLGTLICITWDGKMYQRKGISCAIPNGAIWRQIPTPKNRAVIGLTIGTEAIWCITADGMVWFARLEIDRRKMEHTNIEELNFQEVAKSGICRISLTKNDQVFCVGSEKEVMEVRTGIDSSEPSGKKFEVMKYEGNEKKRWISICAASSNLSNIPKYLLDPRVLQARQEIFQFKNTFWRKQILESLQISNDKSWEIMKDVKIEKISDDFGCENVERFRKIKAQLVVFGDGQRQMRSVNLRISEAVFEIEGERNIDCAMILSSFSGFQRLPQKYLLHILVKNEAQPISFAFTDESSRNSCQEIVDNIIRSYITTSARNSLGQSMWTISNSGSVRWHCLAEMDPKFEKEIPLSDTRSLTVPGNFESIDCGANRLVWAVNFAGDLYSLHPRFDPLSTLDHTFEYRQTDELRHELYEYQKSAIFRGFVTFQGQQKGVSAWMSKNEGAAPQFYSGLASKFWTWIDAEWRLEDSDEDSWEYSNEIDGNFEIGVGKGEGKIRRRCWIRRAKFETNKSVWAKVEGPSVKVVRVAKVENQNSVTVITLTRDGHLLLRLGVNRENFTGSSWSQIVTDSPITAFHIQKHEKIWCITTESLIIWKTLVDTEQDVWNYLDMNLPSRKVVVTQKDADICGSNDILYLRSRNVLFRIDSANLTCSDPYPMENLRQAVVNLQGQICLLGSNISIVNEWKVMLYEDKKTTIIQPRSMNRAMNFGKSIICIAMY